jgi:hypothetical protein
LLNEGLPVRDLAEGVIDELALIKQKSSQNLYLPRAYLITNASDDFILVHWIICIIEFLAVDKLQRRRKQELPRRVKRTK